jgi:hypothetical protein
MRRSRCRRSSAWSSRSRAARRRRVHAAPQRQLEGGRGLRRPRDGAGRGTENHLRWIDDARPDRATSRARAPAAARSARPGAVRMLDSPTRTTASCPGGTCSSRPSRWPPTGFRSAAGWRRRSRERARACSPTPKREHLLSTPTRLARRSAPRLTIPAYARTLTRSPTTAPMRSTPGPIAQGIVDKINVTDARADRRRHHPGQDDAGRPRQLPGEEAPAGLHDVPRLLGLRHVAAVVRRPRRSRRRSASSRTSTSTCSRRPPSTSKAASRRCRQCTS